MTFGAEFCLLTRAHDHSFIFIKLLIRSQFMLNSEVGSHSDNDHAVILFGEVMFFVFVVMHVSLSQVRITDSVVTLRIYLVLLFNFG